VPFEKCLVYKGTTRRERSDVQGRRHVGTLAVIFVNKDAFAHAEDMEMIFSFCCVNADSCHVEMLGAKIMWGIDGTRQYDAAPYNANEVHWCQGLASHEIVNREARRMGRLRRMMRRARLHLDD